MACSLEAEKKEVKGEETLSKETAFSSIDLALVTTPPTPSI